MIRFLSNNYFAALLFSAIVILVHSWAHGLQDPWHFVQIGLLFSQGIILDQLCARFRILGIKSHIPLVMIALLSILLVHYLSPEMLMIGYLWLIALYLSFRNREGEAQSVHSLIYIGVLLGIAQIIDQWAVFLFLPFFIMFYQSAMDNIRHYFLSIFYFFLVLIIYSGVIYVMEIIDQAWNLVPQPSFDYSLFNTPLIKVFLPFTLLMLIVHFLALGNYRFRYPNRSIIINYMMLIQLIIGSVLILITVNPGFFILLILPIGVLLSVGFSFKRESVFINAGFMVYVLLILGISVLEWQGYIHY